MKEKLTVKQLPTCKECGRVFMPNHRKQVYCSDRCRQRAWVQKNKPKK